MSVQLVRPHSRYKESYLTAMQEFADEGLNMGSIFNRLLPYVESDFEEYVKRVSELAEGKWLYDLFAPTVVYWVVDGNEYIGHVSLRVELNPKLEEVGGHIGVMLRSSQRGKGYGTAVMDSIKEKAREHGLDRLLCTCKVENIASNKMITKAGGVLLDTTQRNGIERNRYWIDI